MKLLPHNDFKMQLKKVVVVWEGGWLGKRGTIV